MASYTCLDCGNKSSKNFPSGKCPGCGSFNIKSPKSLIKKENPKTKTKKEIILMTLLWGYIAYETWRRYLS